jgi:hypothetical protein
MFRYVRILALWLFATWYCIPFAWLVILPGYALVEGRISSGFYHAVEFTKFVTWINKKQDVYS